MLRHANEREVVDNPIKLKYAPIKSGRPRYFTDQEEAEIVSYLLFESIGWPTWSRCPATPVCAKVKSSYLRQACDAL